MLSGLVPKKERKRNSVLGTKKEKKKKKRKKEKEASETHNLEKRTGQYIFFSIGQYQTTFRRFAFLRLQTGRQTVTKQESNETVKKEKTLFSVAANIEGVQKG